MTNRILTSGLTLLALLTLLNCGGTDTGNPDYTGNPTDEATPTSAEASPSPSPSLSAGLLLE